MENEKIIRAAEAVERVVNPVPLPSQRHWSATKICKCGATQYAGWDPDCPIALHRQIYDRPMGMTD